VTVQRDETEDANKKWAEESNAKIETVQDAVSKAKTNLNGDAQKAVEAVRGAQTSYTAFDKKYNDALERFKDGVSAAQEKEKEFRENVKFVGNLLLCYASPFYKAATGAAGSVLGTIESVAKLAEGIGAVPKPKDKPAGESDKNVGPSPQVDWSGLLTTTIDSFEKTLSQNKSLDSMSDQCIQLVRFLGSVRSGTFSGSDPRGSTQGDKVTTMADNATGITGGLSAIGTSEVSGPATPFRAETAKSLDKVTGLELEQRIAMKWISGLTKDQLDEIDTAEDYLSMIKVIGAEGSRLSYDTGMITTSDDEQIVQMLAQVEHEAMNLVGQTADWLGGRRFADAVAGEIRDDAGRTWNAAATKGTSEEGGGQVRITAYSVARSQSEAAGWEWSRPANLREQLFRDVTFTVTPTGPTGGGVVEGPVLRPAAKSR
jgi:hypothetical protein